jgi:hypothetical protein
MGDKPVTRADLRRKLAVNALTKPVNVAVPAVVVVGSIVVGAPWLLVVAAVAYAVLAAMTFLDEREAKRVGDAAYGRTRPQRPRLETRQLAPEIRAEVESARAEQARIAQTIAGADLPFAEVGGEVDRLVGAMEATARRAQLVREYLDTQDVARIEARMAQAGSGETAEALRDQLTVLSSLTAQLRRFHDEMEQVNAALGAMHARLVGAAVASQESADAELAGDVRDLRERVETLTDGIAEAYAATSS